MRKLGSFITLLWPLFATASYSEVDLRQNATYQCVDLATDKNGVEGSRESIEPLSYRLRIKDHEIIVEGSVSFIANAQNDNAFHLEKSGAYLKTDNATLIAQVSDNELVYFLSHNRLNNANGEETYEYESAGTCMRT